ncbi:hypothetical protein FACS1894111_08190 [Clostridia bacterium]|nr:hypothetical protein FACS1894111_08190 [Clostridia bacterium]
MKIDYANSNNITSATVSLAATGTDSVISPHTGDKEEKSFTASSYSVKKTMVQKSSFSFESELDKMKQNLANADTDAIKKQVSLLCTTLSAPTAGQIEEKGFPLSDSSIDTIVTVMDRIKMELAKGGMDISIFGQEYSSEQLQAITGDAAQARQMASSIESLKDGDVKYMIANELPPTVNNIYFAEHSNSTAQPADLPALKQDTSVLPQAEQIIARTTLPINDTTLSYSSFLIKNDLPLTPENLEYMNRLKEWQPPANEAEITTLLQEAVAEGKEPKEAILLPGYSEKERAAQVLTTIIKTTDNDLRYVIEKELPLNPESLKQAQNAAAHLTGQAANQNSLDNARSRQAQNQDLQESTRLRQTRNQDLQENTPFRQVQNGIANPLAGGESVEASTPFRQAQNTIANPTAQEEALEQVPPPTSGELKQITARRQLEEIRLNMTVAANYQLLKQGISIETRDLSLLVEDLKSMESNYYKSLLSENGITPSDKNAALFQNVSEKTAELKTLPAYAIGHRPLFLTNIDRLHESGKLAQTAFTMAEQRYETMMTVPGNDLGDSIQKAFQNVDKILEDLDLEVSPANQRAIRILGYNSLDITASSIAEMKADDQKVQRLFQTLTPPVVMEMIRQGVNPLEMDIVSLTSKAEEIRQEQQGISEEKFSKYLWKLEQKQEISPEEKESYIGIYRLLNQIEKTDGAAIGSLVRQGKDLSLMNLLTDIRSHRAKQTDVTVDDSFGILGHNGQPKNSIYNQIQTAYQTYSAISKQAQARDQKNVPNLEQEQARDQKNVPNLEQEQAIYQQNVTGDQQTQIAYQTDCAKEVFHHLTQEAAEKLLHNRKWQELTPEQLLREIKENPVSEENEERYLKKQVSELRESISSEAALQKSLRDYDIAPTPANLLAASRMMYQRNGVFRNLFSKEALEKEPNLSAAKEATLKAFANALSSPEDMAKAQQALAETAEHIMEGMKNEESIRSLDLRDLKILRRQIKISSTLAKGENYAVPVMIGDELTNVSVKIVRGKQKIGRVDIFFETANAGKVAAHLKAEKDGIRGSVITDSRETRQRLQDREEAFRRSFGENENFSVHLDFMENTVLPVAELSKGGEKLGLTESERSSGQVQTRRLYALAKGFLEAVKASVIAQ